MKVVKRCVSSVVITLFYQGHVQEGQRSEYINKSIRKIEDSWRSQEHLIKPDR